MTPLGPYSNPRDITSTVFLSLCGDMTGNVQGADFLVFFAFVLKSKKKEQNAEFLIRCGAVVLSRRPCSAVIE